MFIFENILMNKRSLNTHLCSALCSSLCSERKDAQCIFHLTHQFSPFWKSVVEATPLCFCGTLSFPNHSSYHTVCLFICLYSPPGGMGRKDRVCLVHI